MADHIRFERRGDLFHVDIDMPMASSKAAAIAEAVEEDAGKATVDMFAHRRRHRLVACGLVRAATMRHVLDELAR